MAPIGVKVIRGVFGVGERVAPGLTARAAFALFARTPDPRKLSEGERRAVARAGDMMAEARHHHLATNYGCVMLHDFRPEPGRAPVGRVLVLHGWRSRTEYMTGLIEGFRQAGYRVLSLDLPGHGGSAGRRLTVASAVDAVRVAGEWFGPFDAVVGHSFGGAVAVNALAGTIKGIAPLPAERLVLISAPSSMPAVFDQFGDHLNLGPRSRAAISDVVQRIAGRPLADFVGERHLADLKTPTLVIHAPDDREVSADSARSYASAGDHVEIHWAEGLGHRRILSDKGVIGRAVSFVTGDTAAVDRAIAA